jgi:SAM-dependent MidA family methyltransferase
VTVTRDEFESITESGPLVRELRDRITADGAITFRDFMAAALYHQQYGYYMTSSGTMGRGGDYVTGPEVHPIFGALVAKQLHQLWEAMHRPARFDIVEQGAGSGLLARDILRGSERDPAFVRAIRYRIIEHSPALERAQREKLRDFEAPANRIEWLAAMPAGVVGCVLSNELLDAFPVHRLVRRGADLLEVFVSWGQGRFIDEVRPLSDDALSCYFHDLGLLPGDGCYAEVNLDAPRWMASVAQSLERGYVLTFDYGYEAAQLYAPWRRDGTLLCFYRQTASSDPYQRIGKQDMTASVDFTTLRLAGEHAGLGTVAMTTQSEFLVRLGIGEGVAAVAGVGSAQMEEYFARRRVVMDLIDPGKLGRVTALLQGKNVSERRFDAFERD